MEIPESSLIRKTFTIRTMDFPPNIKLTKRSLLRWFALAFGLISEKESRTTVFEVLDALFYFNVSKKSAPSIQEIQAYIKKKHSKNISIKLLRYHLNRIKETDLIIRKKQAFLFNPAPFAERDDLKASFNHFVSKNIAQTLVNLEDAFFELSLSYKNK